MAFVMVEKLTKKFGEVTAVNDISFAVEAGKIMTLLGPSGCGKTTTLRCVAGLEEPDRGEILVDGKIFSSSEKGLFVPPENRNIGMVFQSYAVWPHKTIFENVALGLKIKRLDRATVGKKTLQALEMVRLNGLEKRYPTQVSGGQQQRVALARSLAQEPKLLLFDEPLSNLDLVLRQQMRFEIRELQRKMGITSIYVTHDQTEAMVISDVVCVMNNGRIVQVGAPMEIYNKPNCRFVAEFIGSTNLLKCTIIRGGRGIVQAELGDGRPMLCHSSADRAKSDEAFVSIRPESIKLCRSRPKTSDNVNIFEARIEQLVFLGNLVEYKVHVSENEFLVQSFSSEVYPEGEKVFMEIPAKDCMVLEE